MTREEEAKIRALQQHPDCMYAQVENGMNLFLQRTFVVNLWRNEETWAAGDPPRHVVEGFLA